MDPGGPHPGGRRGADRRGHASPVGAAGTLTKKKVKKIATNVVNKLAPGIADSAARPLATRVAFALGPAGTTPVPVNGTVISTTITAPKSGFLVMQAGGDWFDSDTDVYGCRLHVNGTEVPGTAHDIESDVTVTEMNCETEGILQVAAGTHTVDLVSYSVDGTPSHRQDVLIVEWVPLNATGVTP